MSFHDDELVPPTPAAVAQAYQIIDLYEENMRLRSQVAHLKEYKQKYFDELDNTIKHSRHMIDNMIMTVIDPNSVINKGRRKLAEEGAAQQDSE